MPQQAAKRTPQQNITRECHVLPVCYQNSFTNPNEELFVQFLDRSTPISLHPKVVGKINDFYTRIIDGAESDGVEKFFNHYVESEYAPIANRIKEQRNEFTLLNAHEIPTLLKFVVTQVVRTEAHRSCVDEQAGITVPQDVFIHNMRRKMKLIIDKWMRQMPELVFWTTLPHVGSRFITGDNPVVCFSQTEDFAMATLTPDLPKIIDLNLSLESPHNGFMVPLSPYVCLTVINSGRRKTVEIREMQAADPRDVRDLNKKIYNQCVNFIASKNLDDLRIHVNRNSR